MNIKRNNYETPAIKRQEIELEQVIAESNRITTDDNQPVTETWEDVDLDTGDITLV